MHIFFSQQETRWWSNYDCKQTNANDGVPLAFAVFLSKMRAFKKRAVLGFFFFCVCRNSKWPAAHSSAPAKYPSVFNSLGSKSAGPCFLSWKTPSIAGFLIEVSVSWASQILTQSNNRKMMMAHTVCPVPRLHSLVFVHAKSDSLWSGCHVSLCPPFSSLLVRFKASLDLLVENWLF